MKTHSLVYLRIGYVDSFGANDPSVSPPFLSGSQVAIRHVALRRESSFIRMVCLNAGVQISLSFPL